MSTFSCASQSICWQSSSLPIWVSWYLSTPYDNTCLLSVEMAEAFGMIGLAASIVQFVDFGSKVAKKLKDVTAGSGTETLLVQNILPLLLTSLKDLGKRIDFGDVDDETQKAVSLALEGMTALVKDLEELLDLYLVAGSKKYWKKWVKAAIAVLMGRNKRLKGMLEDLRHYHSALMLQQTVFIPKATTSSTGIPFMVPFPKDENFVNRSDLIRRMREILESRGLVILAGIGGSG
jgi:hypothetical protein